MPEPLQKNDLLRAIIDITAETGFPPTAEELREAFGLRLIQSTSAWRALVREGVISYDAEQRVVVDEVVWRGGNGSS